MAMSIRNAQPADNYEGLRTQFFALKRLLLSKEVQVDYYQQQIMRFRFERIICLEAELESEKEMNAILTKELELKNTL